MNPAPRNASHVTVCLVLLLLVSAVAAGCGGDGATTATFETASSVNSESVEFKSLNRALKAAEKGDCEARPCNAGGVSVVAAPAGGTLKLRELDVDLLGSETTKSISDRFDTTKTADGTYVVLELKILNKTGNRVFVDGNFEQMYLYLGGKGYSEDFEVENYSLESSFVNQGHSTAAGATERGTIAFDVPSRLVPELEKSAILAVLNFSEEGEPETADQIGLLHISG